MAAKRFVSLFLPNRSRPELTVDLTLPVPPETLSLPKVNDPRGWLVRLPGGHTLVGERDFEVTIDGPKRGDPNARHAAASSTVQIRFLPEVEAQVRDLGDENALLEYQAADERRYYSRLTSDSAEFQDFLDFAWETFGRSGLKPARHRFWQLVHRALLRWLDPLIWWAERPPEADAGRSVASGSADVPAGEWDSFVSPFPETTLKEYRAAGGFSVEKDYSSFQFLKVPDEVPDKSPLLRLQLNLEPLDAQDARPHAWIDGADNDVGGADIYVGGAARKVKFVVFLALRAGGLSTRKTAAVITLIEDMSRILARLMPQAGDKEGPTKDKPATDPFSELLFRIRNDALAAAKVDPIVAELPEGGEVLETVGDHSLALGFIALDAPSSRYRYVCDPEQLLDARRQLQPLDAGEPAEVVSQRLDAFLPVPLIEQVATTRLPLFCPGDDPALSPDFGRLFSPTGGVDGVQFFPVVGRPIEETEDRVILIVQFTWPRKGERDLDGPLFPFVPELRLALERALLEQEANMVLSYTANEYNRRYARFQFVRGVSWFIGHNLPKTTVTPLKNLAFALKHGDDSSFDRAQVGQRLEVLANLLDLQLHALDIFRVRQDSSIQLEAVPLQAVLQDIASLFQFLKDDRAQLRGDFAAIKDHVGLDLPDTDVLVQGYRPAVFHALYAPVENALRHLDPVVIASNPERGRIVVRIARRSNGVEVEIADQGPGMDPARLREVRSWLAEARDNAGSEAALAIHFGRRAAGQQLGLGLVLAAYFLAMLRTGAGERGGIEIENSQGHGTRVTLFFPDNSGQESIALGS